MINVKEFLRAIADPNNAVHQAAIAELVSMLQTSGSDQFDIVE